MHKQGLEKQREWIKGVKIWWAWCVCLDTKTECASLSGDAVEVCLVMKTKTKIQWQKLKAQEYFSSFFFFPLVVKQLTFGEILQDL